jgi:cytochrome c2
LQGKERGANTVTIPGLNLPPRLALVAGARLPRPNVCHVARLLAVVIAAWLALVPVAHAQPDEDDDALPFLPGLAAEYRTESGTSCRRVDDAVAFNWGSAMPDARLGKPGPFAAEWRGQLVVPAAGTYRFWAFAAGEVAIALEGKEILRASADQPQWLAADSLELTFGRKPLEVRYRRTRAEGRVALFWAGPQFAREPLGGRWLWHARENTPPKQFERGAELARALRCTACHPTTGQRPPSPGPDLDRLAGNVHSAWLVDWLSSDADGKSAAAPTRRMPHFGLSREDAQAVAAYLLADNAAASAPKQPAGSLPKASANKGERHVHVLGCLACHQIGSLGTKGLWDGGDLSTLAAKHPGDFFARWLADPAAINKQHRMPVYDLPIADRNDIAAYLATLGKPPAAESARNAPTDGALMARGLNLVEKYRCAACHVLPGKPAAPGAAKALKAQSNWMAACTTAAATGAASHRPGYNLSPDDAGALRDYFAALDVSAVASNQANQPPLDGKRILVERNCTACHSRGSARGLAPIVGDVAAARPELAELVPAMTPPSLESVGDKLHDAALVAAIAGTQGVHRPWLAARMPVYKLPPKGSAAQAATRWASGFRRAPRWRRAGPTLPCSATAFATRGSSGLCATPCESCRGWKCPPSSFPSAG